MISDDVGYNSTIFIFLCVSAYYPGQKKTTFEEYLMERGLRLQNHKHSVIYRCILFFVGVAPSVGQE